MQPTVVRQNQRANEGSPAKRRLKEAAKLRRDPERVCPGPSQTGTASFPLGPLGKLVQLTHHTAEWYVNRVKKAASGGGLTDPLRQLTTPV
jgi:hypothetical protein